MTDQDLIVATSLIPCFKLDWEGLNQHSEKDEIKERILKQMEAIDSGTHPCVRNLPVSNFPQNGELSHTIDVTHSESEDPDEESLFFGLNHTTSSRNSTISSTEESAEEELVRSLASSEQNIEDCYGDQNERPYRRLKQLFLYYNTALPSSASVERLFSLVGGVFQADRGKLSDASLEKQSLMCANINIIP